MSIRPLLPPGAPASAAELVTGFGLWERGSDDGPRPRVLLNMVSSLDGRGSLEGRSAGLSGPADRELFHALRTAADAVLVGAGTLRTERYGLLIRDSARVRAREEHGFPAQPLAAIATTSVALDPDLPLLASPEARVAILTASTASLEGARASVEYIRAGTAGTLDLHAALVQLRETFGVELVLCEGGPHLAGQLAADGLLDELHLSLSPGLAGADPHAEETLRIIAGVDLDPPVTLELLGVLTSDSHLFLRYRVVSAERVSRETIESSSLAS
ncbi:MAG TPA: dihydrofolate reductase family protein [Solirubrobacteraceae bacterium]|nr:dihydrofolate reductase family protein [Solirubrobacteraceae bacterium]